MPHDREQPEHDNRSPERVYGRRQADFEEVVDTKTRVAVLEKIAENHENRISDMEDFHRAVVERFDQKIQMDATNQIIIERTLTKAVTSIDTLAESLKTAMTVANKASTLASKHETIGHTVLKMGGLLVLIVSAAWTVLKFYIGG